ncbi:MAG: methylmalonyl-CoA mutase family protein [Chloroflexota bacterium]
MATAEDMERLEEEERRWQKKHKVDQSPPVKTDLDIEVKAVYTPADVQHIDYLSQLGFPGEYPFTRGPYPEMSRHKPWRYSVFTGFDTPEDTNARWKFLYKAGQPAFNIVYDLPSHMGLDPDDPLAEDEVGRVGIPICSTQDVETVFQDLPMGTVPFYGNMETLGAMIVAMYIAAAEKRGLTEDKLPGSISNDPLTTAVSKSTTVFPLKHALRLSCDLIEYACRRMPRFYPLQIKGVNISEGGANIAQEIGFCFSNAICFLDECLRRGVGIDQVAPGITYFLSTTPHLFEEVAKYRAARRLWARMMKERYGAKSPASMTLKFTAIACPLWLQFEEPELNLVRAAVAGLAQALGGAQATPHPGFDEVYAIPNQKSQSLALGTQQVLAEETNITKAVDPLGGSYYVEWLTNQVEQKIEGVMREVAKRGGALAAIESGYMKREIMDYWAQVEREVASGQRVIVRRNKYRVEEEEDPRAKLALHTPDTASVQRYVERVKRLKRERDNSRVQAHLRKLSDAARGSDNLMPYLIEAARDYVTLGEMTRALKEVFGEFKAPAIV